jgi:hypothetical protein
MHTFEGREAAREREKRRRERESRGEDSYVCAKYAEWEAARIARARAGSTLGASYVTKVFAMLNRWRREYRERIEKRRLARRRSKADRLPES